MRTELFIWRPSDLDPAGAIFCHSRKSVVTLLSRIAPVHARDDRPQLHPKA
jgi:hypothetical protein